MWAGRLIREGRVLVPEGLVIQVTEAVISNHSDLSAVCFASAEHWGSGLIFFGFLL